MKKPFEIYFKPDFLFAALLVLLALFTALGAVFRSLWLLFFALLFAVLAVFRILSRNLAARAKENEWAKRILLFVPRAVAVLFRRLFPARHAFATCPHCSARLRFPRQKGTLLLTCPRCQTRFPTTIK